MADARGSRARALASGRAVTMKDWMMCWEHVAFLALALACGHAAGQSLAPEAASTGTTDAEAAIQWQGGWIPESQDDDGLSLADAYAAFRGAFELPHDAEVTIRIIGAHWFQADLDGAFLTEGPARFPLSHPEYETLQRELKAGKHVITAMVHDEGVSTRMLRAAVIPPFLLCEVTIEGSPVEVRWKCARLPGYLASGVRMSPQFAWIEWVDTRANPAGWQAADFDDGTWQTPAGSVASRWTMRPLGIGPVRQFVHQPKRIAEGFLTGPFESSQVPDWPEEGDVSWYRRG